MEQQKSDNTDVMFSPKKMLNVDNVDNNGEVSLQESNYMFHRPAGCVSDMTQPGTNGVSRTEQQGQNMRIIEGLDSSNFKESSECRVAFLHSQMTPLQCGSSVNSGFGNRNVSLFDSVDKESGDIHYKTNTNYAMKNSISEYYRTDSMSHKMQDIDSPRGSDYDNCLSCLQTCVKGNNDSTEKQVPQNKNPEQNPQANALGMQLPRIGTAFAREGETGGCGDVRGTERDNTESLALELSEEGLSHNTSIHPQPVTASAAVTTPSTGGDNACKGDMFVPDLGSQVDWVTYYLSSVKYSQQGCFEEEPTSFCQEPLNSNNVMCSQGLCKGVSKPCVIIEGDQTDAGLNASSIHSKKSHADINESAKMPITSKTHSHRPAVLGSSFSNDTRKPEMLKLHTNSSIVSRKVAQCSMSGSRSGSSSTAVVKETSKVQQCTGDNTTVSKQSMSQSPECISPTSYSKFHIYSATNLASSSFRGSGVGNESTLQASPSYAPVSCIVDTQPNRLMSMAQRLGRSKGDAKTEFNESVKLSDLNSHTGEPPQPYHSQHSVVCDKVQQDAGHEAVMHASYLPDAQFPWLANSQTLCDRENMNKSKDHSSDNHPHSSDARDSESSNSTGCTSVCSGITHSQGQEIHHSRHQCSSSHSPSDCQYVSHQCNNHPVFVQNVSPCASNGSSYSYSKEAFSLQNDFVKRPSIQLSPTEDNHFTCESQVVERIQDHQRNLYTEAEDQVIDQTAAATDLLLSERPVTPSFGASASLFMGTNHHSDMSDILDNFPVFSSKLFEEKATNITYRSSTGGEMKYLTDCLEKERFRRKHCEEHILRQDAKLLEIQQQLAVVISTGKRKDVVVEQLDKQLAKFVESWKKKEAEKDEHIRVLKQEKKQAEETLQSQQAMISIFEQELSKSAEEFSKEKSNSAPVIENLKSEICQAQREIELAEQTLSHERQKHATMTDECSHLQELRELAERRALEAEDQLMKEQDRALKKELELLEKINEMTNSNQKMVDLQLLKLEEENNRQKKTEIENEDLKTELQKSTQAVEQLVKEKESQKAEIADIEMKFKNVQQKLEEDVCAQMEKKIADQASEFYSQMERLQEETAACHARQLGELNTKHQHDLEQQAQLLNTEMLMAERRYQQQLKELEERLQILTTENTLLKESQIKLESQRMEVLSKLQNLMQSQWNEAVSLLVDAPQKKLSSASSLLPDQNSDQLILDTITPVTSLITVLSTPQPMISQANNDESPQGVLAGRYAPSASPATLEVREQMYRTTGVEHSFKKCDDYMALSGNGNNLRVSESCQTSQRISPVLVTPRSGSLQSCYHESPACHNQSDPNDGKQCLTSFNMMNTTPASGRGHEDEIKYRYHMSMKSPQKSLLQCRSAKETISPQKPSLPCRSESSHSSVKSGSDHPPISRNSHIFYEDHAGEGLVTQCHRHAGFKPNHSPHPSLCASFVNEAPRSLTRDSDDCNDMKNGDRSATNVSPYTPGCRTDSSSSFCSHHWAPHSDTAVQHYQNVPVISTEQLDQDTAYRQLYTDVSSVNKYQPAGTGHQLARNEGEINEPSSLPARPQIGQNHVSMSDTSSGCCDSFSYTQTSQGSFCDQTEEHESRQGELQHYIRMLLQNDGSSDSDDSIHLSEAGLYESLENLTGNLGENVSEVELIPWGSQLQDSSVTQSPGAAPEETSRLQLASDANLSHESFFVDNDRGITSTQGRLPVSLVSSCCVEQSSGKDASRPQGVKNVSKPQAARKCPDLSKAKNNSSGSQSASTVLYMSDRQPGGKAGYHRFPKKKSFVR